MGPSGYTNKDEKHSAPMGGKEHPAQVASRIMMHIYNRGMTTTSGGNLSLADESGNTWITPAGTDKGSLRPEDIVCIAPDGNVSGIHKPSSEYPLHRAIYCARPDLRAVIHAHPPVLTSFSIVHRIPDTAVLRKAREICGTVGYAGYELPGSKRLGESVAAEFARGYNAVIMENHAVVVGGRDLTEALVRLETLENCARTIHAAGFIGDVTSLSEEELSEFPGLARDGYLPRTEGKVAAWNDAAGAEICRMVRRACERGLMSGSCGTVSVRQPDNGFLITREGALLWGAGSEDIAQVTYGTRSASEATDSYMWLFDEIYRRFPATRAVIMAQPPYLMAFAVTGREINVRTIPESWIFLQEIPLVPFGAQLPGRNDIFEKLSEGAPAVLIRNDSVLVTGENLLQAFDRLEVAEMTAMSLILGHSLGNVASLSNEHIEELRRTFISPAENRQSGRE